MTLEEAIKQVASVEWVDPADGEMQEAFALVLAAAKRPRVYALSEEERVALKGMTPKRREVLRYRYKSTRWMKTADLREHIKVAASDVNELLDALTAALNLEQPEEPFTAAEWERMVRALSDDAECLEEWGGGNGSHHKQEAEKHRLLAAKLRAYIEKKAAPAQP